MPDNILRIICERRSLIFLLALNDVKLRYRNSVLGFVWSFLEPLLMLTVLYLVFTHVIRADIENYPLYLLLGLIIWYMFSRGSTMGMSSLVEKAGIIQKIYFRREIIVLSSTLTAFIMMTFEFAAFVFFLALFEFIPPLTALLFPLLLIDLFFLTLGLSLILSVLNVKFRDINFIWQVIIQAGFFLSPIIYRMDMFPENIREILQLNPLVPILETAHNLVLYDILPTPLATTYILLSTATIFIVGYIVFRVYSKNIVEAL